MSHLTDIFFDFKVLARNNRQRLRFGHVIKFQVVKVKITLTILTILIIILIIYNYINC